MGQVTLISAEEGGAAVLGRGAGEGERGRLHFHARWQDAASTPLSSRGLSRTQLAIRPREGRLAVMNVGRCAMSGVVGEPVDALLLEPGDFLELRDEMLLMCVRRSLGGLRSARPLGAPGTFGLVGESDPMERLRHQMRAVRPDEPLMVWGPPGSGRSKVASALAGPGAVLLDLAGVRPRERGARIREAVERSAGPIILRRAGSITADEIRQVVGRGVGVLVTGQAPWQDGASLEIPGLDARREDIPLLARHLAVRSPPLRRYIDSVGAAGVRMSVALLRQLLQHDYRRHVSELHDMLVASASAGAGDSLRPLAFDAPPQRP